MAIVSLSIGPLTVQVEDEDASHKTLIRRAEASLQRIASTIELVDVEEAEAEVDG